MGDLLFVVWSLVFGVWSSLVDVCGFGYLGVRCALFGDCCSVIGL